MEYRHENKYFVSNDDLVIIEAKIKNILKYDENAENNDGTYIIRSIYFDDYYDTFFRENEYGVDDRSKIRIRIYGNSDKLIKLEIKYKLNGMTKKESANISRSLCDKLISGEPLILDECSNKVLYRVFLEIKRYNLKPKNIIEYERTAFINYAGNVRITFDRNIKTSNKLELFFDDNILGQPILENRQHILEVKYDEFIPDYIFQTLEINKLIKTSFSKYYISRLTLGGQNDI